MTSTLVAIIIFGILFAIAVVGLMKSNATALRLKGTRQGSGSYQADRDDQTDLSSTSSR